MVKAWNISALVARLKAEGLDDGVATRIALDVGEAVRTEQRRAVKIFKSRLEAVWRSDRCEP